MESRTRRGLAPVAPPLPSIVIKSGPAKTQYSRSRSILPAAILIPIGLPSDSQRSLSTSARKSSLVLIPGNLDGLITSCPRGLLRMAAISGVTLPPGRCPPMPGLVPWPILISMASARRRFSGVTLYRLGTYSKIYLAAASLSSGRIPPSPLHMAECARALPLARDILASFESAPKDMWDMYTGLPSISGFLAFGPITVVVSTWACSSSGGGFSCAPRISMSSQQGMGICVPMASLRGFPEPAIS